MRMALTGIAPFVGRIGNPAYVIIPCLNATGFYFVANDSSGNQAALMGDQVKLADGLKLSAKLPLPAYVRLLRHGEEVAKSEGKAEFEFVPKEPGAYRLEAWLKLDTELRPWIFANPIYVR